MRRFTAFALGALLAASPAAAEIHWRDISVGGATRGYILFVPDVTRVSGAGAGLPLVVTMHGGGVPAELMVHYTNFNALASRENFAVAYPRGTNLWWNDGRLINGRGETDSDDVGFVRALIADIDANVVRLDRRRLFATGISNGGFMSLRLACEASDLFTAIAAVGATMPAEMGARCRPAKPVAAMLINGTADPFVPYMGGYARTANAQRGAIWSTDRTMAFWAQQNGCASPVVRVLPRVLEDEDSHVIESDYRGCARAPVKLFRVEGGGHTWPGGPEIIPSNMIGLTSRDLDASEAIWEFFKSAPPR